MESSTQKYVDERDQVEEQVRELPEGEPDWPEYHHNGMGCGLEDRGITDRYEAMQHGWEDAFERCVIAFNDWLAAAPSAGSQKEQGEVVVSRELRSVLAMILNALDRDAAEGKQVRREMAEELRALLDKISEGENK